MNILDSLILNPEKRLLPTASVTSLYPITKLVTNHPLPTYPSPIMYDPINVLLLAWKSRMTNKK